MCTQGRKCWERFRNTPRYLHVNGNRKKFTVPVMETPFMNET